MSTTAAPPATSPPTRRASRRVDGVDLARGLAIIGMVMVHVAPRIGPDGGWYSISYGRASTLFAVVAGIGVELASRRGPALEHRARLVWRATWLVPVGIGLSMLGTPVAVILQYYAVWFLLTVPVVRLRTSVLAPLTAIGLLVGPTVLVWAQVEQPGWYVFREGSIAGRGAWLGEFGDVLLTGYYPTVSWLWLVWAGMLVARLDLSSDRVAGALLAGGATVAVATYAVADRAREALDLGRWEPWLDTTGHADTPPEMLASLATAVAVVGACVLLARHLRLLLSPLTAFGRFALTIYVVHIVLYAMFPDAFRNDTTAGGLTVTLWITVVGSIGAMLWLLVAKRGPLEALDRGGYRVLVAPLVDIVRGERT